MIMESDFYDFRTYFLLIGNYSNFMLKEEREL